MKKAIRYLFLLGFLYVCILLLDSNIKAYRTSDIWASKPTQVVNKVHKQLRFVRATLDRGSGTDMQRLFPEGYVFIHAIYAMAWSELVSLDPSLTKQAIPELTWALKALENEQGTKPFDINLKPEYGLFYCAWVNLVRKQLVSLYKNPPKELLKRYEEASAELVKAFRESPTPFLESYKGRTWPADAFPAVASLDKKRYRPFIKKWLQRVKLLVHPGYKLVGHTAYSRSLAFSSIPRGCSQVLMLRFLLELDPTLALQQYKLFRKHFRTTVLGGPLIREYPIGINGRGDVDSGPILFGVGMTASIVAVGTMQAFGDRAYAEGMLQVIEAFGFSLETKKHIRYLYGVLPMADAFLAWSKATKPRLKQLYIEPPSTWWRLGYHLASLPLFLLFFLFCYRTFRPKQPKIILPSNTED